MPPLTKSDRRCVANAGSLRSCDDHILRKYLLCTYVVRVMFVLCSYNVRVMYVCGKDAKDLYSVYWRFGLLACIVWLAGMGASIFCGRLEKTKSE